MPRFAKPSVARRLTGTLAAWIAVLAVLRLAVVAPETCPIIDAGDLRRSATETVAWFERNQQPDGRWLYRYDRDADADLGDYNVVRHAGVTMSLYQAHRFGHDDALAVADRGTDYALDHLVRHDDWAAFEPGSGLVSTGATGLLVAGLAERRAATGDERHDDLLGELGRFLLAVTEPRGSVLAAWDQRTGAPVPDTYSPFFTGEIYWAFTLLHRELPGEGWDEPARRIGAYVATERDDAENWFPDLPDHWAAYGLAVEAEEWPDAAGDAPLTAEQVAYVEQQAKLGSIQVRWESQRTNEWPNWWLRGRQTLGSGLGTLGEQLTMLWAAARADHRLHGLADDIGARATCVAGMVVDRQVGPEEAAADPDPGRSRGAWFQFGVTQMDDQQHALSAVLLAEPIVAATGPVAAQPQQVERPWGDGAPWLLAALALLVALNPARASAAVPSGPPRDRLVFVGVAGGATALALGVVALVSGPVVDALDASVATVRVGAGLVLAVTGVVDLVRALPSARPALAGWRAGLVPVAVPALLRPASLVVALSAGADRGVALVVALAVAAALLAAAAVAAGAPRTGMADHARSWAARVLAAGAVVLGVVLTVDGVLDV